MRGGLIGFAAARISPPSGLPRGSGPCQQRRHGKDGCAKSCVPTTHAAPLIAPSLPSPASPLGRPATPSQPGLRKGFQTRFKAPGASRTPRRQRCGDGKTRPQPGSALVSGHRCRASGSVGQDPACSISTLPALLAALPQAHGAWGSPVHSPPLPVLPGTHSCTICSPEGLKSPWKG